jgi:hypothetical protein
VRDVRPLVEALDETARSAARALVLVQRWHECEEAMVEVGKVDRRAVFQIAQRNVAGDDRREAPIVGTAQGAYSRYAKIIGPRCRLQAECPLGDSGSRLGHGDAARQDERSFRGGRVPSGRGDSEGFTWRLAAAERGSNSGSVQSMERRSFRVRSLGPPSDGVRRAGSRSSDGPAMQPLIENWFRRASEL